MEKQRLFENEKLLKHERGNTYAMKKENYIHRSHWFYGHKISDYGIEHGYVDYATLAKSFNLILNNDIMEKTASIGFWEPVQGFDMDEDGDNLQEIFQFFIIDDCGAKILQELTNEILFYNEELDMWVWGISHYGTGWEYVLTDIPIVLDNK